MGALARDRWRRATGQELPAVEPGLDAWPATLDADIADVRIGIARTRAAYAGDEEVREIEALYAEMIAGAERWIYVENQYLTSVRVVEWLRRRLDEQGGPEVVVVGPRENAGWLEQQTMGVLRRRAVERLRASAGADRLRILYPDEAGLPPSEMIHVHSKLMVVDDDWLRIGSANLANRSMGVDTECDVVIDAEGREEVRRAIGDFRDDLLAEHLGVDVADVSETLARSGSLVATIDALADEKGRTLRHLDVGRSEEGPEAVELVRLADPEHPAPLEELVRRFESEQAGSSSVDGERRRWGMRAMGLGAAAAALILWQWAEIAPWLDARRWAELLLSLRGEQRAPLVGLLVFVVASLLFVPLSALSVAAGVAFGPVTGAGVAWAGSVGSSALGYGAGRVLWRDTVRRLAGRRLNRLSRRLGRQGFLSSLLLALLPVAPYTLANLVAGASHVRARDFLLGTLVGVLPWSVAMALFGDFAARIAESGWEGMAELSAVAAGAILLGGLLRLVARSAARGADRAARGSRDPGA
jgi:uncharacterized membrane protein YdjX (TVP38/TMEM64 family)